jgi:hypothetical protein
MQTGYASHEIRGTHYGLRHAGPSGHCCCCARSSRDTTSEHSSRMATPRDHARNRRVRPETVATRHPRSSARECVDDSHPRPWVEGGGAGVLIPYPTLPTLAWSGRVDGGGWAGPGRVLAGWRSHSECMRTALYRPTPPRVRPAETEAKRRCWESWRSSLPRCRRSGSCRSCG